MNTTQMCKLEKIKLKLFVLKQCIYKNSSYPNIINVSLTYLRGLEIAELKEEDMPMVK